MVLENWGWTATAETGKASGGMRTSTRSQENPPSCERKSPARDPRYRIEKLFGSARILCTKSPDIENRLKEGDGAWKAGNALPCARVSPCSKSVQSIPPSTLLKILSAEVTTKISAG